MIERKKERKKLTPAGSFGVKYTSIVNNLPMNTVRFRNTLISSVTERSEVSSERLVCLFSCFLELHEASGSRASTSASTSATSASASA